MEQHERDSEGRCKHCLRAGEKAALIDRIERATDPTQRAVLMLALRLVRAGASVTEVYGA